MPPRVPAAVVSALAMFAASILCAQSPEPSAVPAAAVEQRQQQALAPTTAPANVDAEVEALLKQLAGDDWPTRTAAQSRLVALAEAAEPRLRRAASESDDAEVRTRCEAALAQIADNRLIGPTLITLDLANAPPRDAYAELARQAGFELRLQSTSLLDQELPPVTIRAQRQPLWEVVGQLREQCRLDFEPWSTGLMLAPVSPRGAATPVSVHGPFRVRATRVARSAAVDLTGGAAVTNDFTLMLALQAEPKLRIGSLTNVAKVDLAEDENGLSLLPDDAAGAGAGAAAAAAADPVRARRAIVEHAGRVSSGMTVSNWPASARLEYPPGAGKRIARVRGTLACNLIVRSETIEVPDLLESQNVTRELGGSTITIKSCKKVGSQYEVALSLTRDAAAGGVGAAAAQRLVRGSGQHEGIRLVDATGREMRSVVSNLSTMNGRIDMTLRYVPVAPGPVAAAGAPVKLIWQVPTDARDVEVPFEFTDLPMP